MTTSTEAGWKRVKEQFVAQYVERTPRSAELYERSRRLLPGGVAGNALFREPHPLYVAEAHGKTVVDVDGNEYLDMLIGGGPQILGHSPRAVTDAVVAQLPKGTSALAPSEHALAMAEAISRHMPHIESMRFVATGSEAMQMTMRAARAYSGREKIGKFEGNFHGGYDNQLVSGRDFAGAQATPGGIGDGAGIPQSVVDDMLILPFNDLEATTALIERHAGELAAVVLEPIAGTWMGGVPALPDFVKGLRAVTKEHGILLIFDEIVTGFRVSLGGAADYFGATPDLTALAKIIGGGFPLGAFGGRREIMDTVLGPPRTADEVSRKMFHSGTFANNFVSLVAGLTLIEELEKPGVLERINALGDRLRDGIDRLAAHRGIVLQTTGIGSLVGIHFAPRPVHNLRDVLASDRLGMGTFCQGLIANDIYITTYHLALTNGSQDEADIDHVLEVADSVLATMAESVPTASTAVSR